jgi:hypothetical protein
MTNFWNPARKKENWSLSIFLLPGTSINKSQIFKLDFKVKFCLVTRNLFFFPGVAPASTFLRFLRTYRKNFRMSYS